MSEPSVFERFGVEEHSKVPNRKTGLAFLMQDGNLKVPCSRYGSDSEDCAPVAWRIGYLFARESGQPLTYNILDWSMCLVVNDHDDVEYIVKQYGYRHYT